jgi:hypothetical protein
MKKIIIAIAILLASSSVLAATEVSCAGQYNSGGVFHLLLDLKTNTINAEGFVHKIIDSKYTDHKQHILFRSESYINNEGTDVYLTFKMIPPDSGHVVLYNSVTNNVIVETNMSCYKND